MPITQAAAVSAMSGAQTAPACASLDFTRKRRPHCPLTVRWVALIR